MGFLRQLNKKLNKRFEGKVEAHEEGNCLFLTGELEHWNDIVFAGRIAVEKNPYVGLVNDIVCTGEAAMPMRKPRFEDSAIEWEETDVLIIGGGVIGCAIARELSKYKLDVLLVEKEHDLAMQASGRNDGMIHTGIDLPKGTKKFLYNKQGNPMFDKLCAEMGVSFKRSGQYICFANRLWEPFMRLSLLYWKFQGLKGVKFLKRDELRSYEPGIDPNVRSALFFPDTGVLSPFELTIAYAENAVQNGVSISLDTMVTGMTTEDGVIKSVTTNRGTIHPKLVVNAAGVFADTVASLAGDRFFSIHPRKGTTAIIDKKYADSLVQTAISSIGTASPKKRHTKGGGVIRTIDGNVLVGPDAVETIHREDFSTASFNLNEILSAHSKTVPGLDEEQIITYFSGIRAATYEEDFIVCKGKYVTNMVHAAGIQSPGLTAAPAISLDIVDMVLDFLGGEKAVGLNANYDPKRVPPPRPALMDEDTRNKLIEANPDYGIIICRCEEISKGEVLNALRRNVPCDSIDGVKRRVRPGMGRCQGGFCGPQVLDLIATETRVTPQAVKKCSLGSEVLYGNIKSIQKNKPVVKKPTETKEPAYKSPEDNATERLLRAHAAAKAGASEVRKDDDYDDE